MNFSNNEGTNSSPFQYYSENKSPTNVDLSKRRSSAKRSLKEAPPDSYTSRISCPSRRDFYKNLENERRNREPRNYSGKPIRQSISPNPEEMSRSILSAALKQATEEIQKRQRHKICNSAPAKTRSFNRSQNSSLQPQMSNRRVSDVYQDRITNDDRRGRCRNRIEDYAPEIVDSRLKYGVFANRKRESRLIPLSGTRKQREMSREDRNNLHNIVRNHEHDNGSEGPPTFIFRPLTHRRTLYLVQSRTMHIDIKPRRVLSETPNFNIYRRRSSQVNEIAPKNKRNSNNNMQNYRGSISRMPELTQNFKKQTSRTETRQSSQKINPISTSHSVAIKKSNSNTYKPFRQNMTVSNFTLLNRQASFNRNLVNQNGVPIEKNSMLTDRKTRLNERLNRILAQNPGTFGPLPNKIFKSPIANRNFKRSISPVRRNMVTPINKLSMNFKPLPINFTNINHTMVNIKPKTKVLESDTLNLNNTFFHNYSNFKELPDTSMKTFKTKGQISNHEYNLTLKGDSETEIKTNETCCQT